MPRDYLVKEKWKDKGGPDGLGDEPIHKDRLNEIVPIEAEVATGVEAFRASEHELDNERHQGCHQHQKNSQVSSI